MEARVDGGSSQMDTQILIIYIPTYRKHKSMKANEWEWAETEMWGDQVVRAQQRQSGEDIIVRCTMSGLTLSIGDDFFLESTWIPCTTMAICMDLR